MCRIRKTVYPLLSTIVELICEAAAVYAVPYSEVHLKQAHTLLNGIAFYCSCQMQ